MTHRYPKGCADWRASVGIVLLGAALVWPSVGAASPSCSISPRTPTIEVGATIPWSANVKDISSYGRRYAWEFGEGSPSSSESASPTVRYNRAGSFETKLKVRDRRREAECKTTITLTVTDNQGATSTDKTTAIISEEGGGNGPNISINSTSVDDLEPTSAVPEGPQVSNSGYTLLAVNDLGMHCGDLDTRISSILPLFNVLHAQVVERAVNGLPRVMGEDEVELFYSAASNPDDPVLGKSVPDQALSSVVNGKTYKTNFWNIAFEAYDPFYPDNVLELFYDSANPANNLDVGLPVPDVERLYLGDGELHASQQAMPGVSSPYLSNDPQRFEEHIGTLPFFTGFPFGYTAELNLFEAAGVPISAFDDFGRENPYPLVRVEAHVNSTPVASLDTVMPISGEAECQRCHGAKADGGNGVATGDLVNVAVSLDDPDHGNVPNAVSVEWASDKNILKIHDQKHGTNLIAGTTEDFPTAGTTPFKPVVCQTCHYTPALDLAQLGPLGPENDFKADFKNNGAIISSPSVANGRDQVKHKSMSNAMHSHHGKLDVNGLSPGENGYNAGNLLFEAMPPAIEQGTRRDPLETQRILEATCYSCHPGKRTQCMRGAMANAGLVCQDCHGQMAQVGDDFSRNVDPDNPGAFELAADFYHNPNTPRVPWANEPGCGSCHTGYATDNLAGDANVLVNPTDTLGNSDGIRLLAAYRTDDSKATPIVPTNKAFAETVVAEGAAADGNPKLYRVSTGHGGLFCESCHGSTHAEWPNAKPNANDNVAANQLQGHAGTISECSTCHVTSQLASNTQGGPHGMHLVNDRRFWKEGHKDAAKQQNGRPGGGTCGACHGSDHLGTVLSRTQVTRRWDVEDSIQPTVLAGKPVGCNHCHSLNKSFGR